MSLSFPQCNKNGMGYIDDWLIEWLIWLLRISESCLDKDLKHTSQKWLLVSPIPTKWHGYIDDWLIEWLIWLLRTTSVFSWQLLSSSTAQQMSFIIKTYKKDEFSFRSSGGGPAGQIFLTSLQRLRIDLINHHHTLWNKCSPLGLSCLVNNLNGNFCSFYTVC